MNLRSIDLNLLTVLDALLDEAHVSRAAERIGLSQPAASSALERCRHLFQDPLLERAGNAMRLTPKALALRAPLKQALASVGEVVGMEEEDIATVARHVRVIMSDYPAVLVARLLHRELGASAPKLDIVIQPWLGAAAAIDSMERGESDIAVSVFPAIGAAFQRREVLQERYVVAMRRGHPAAARLTLKKWLAYPHVLVSGNGALSGALDEELATHGLARRVAMVVPSFLMVPPLLADSDLIAMLPAHCVPKAGRGGDDALACFRPPLPVAGFPLHLAWHKRRDDDIAVKHVVQALERIFKTQFAGG
jgi:DNA-binding transcriptional LysR family regulator